MIIEKLIESLKKDIEMLEKEIQKDEKLIMGYCPSDFGLDDDGEILIEGNANCVGDCIECWKYNFKTK